MVNMSSEFIQSLTEILESHGAVRLAILFGSVAKGEVHQESDLGVAVRYRHSMSVKTRLQLIEELALLSGRPVDLVDLDTVGEPLLGQILDNSRKIEHPVQAAFYLMTRIAYLRPFKDGNKRTSRAICNVPLIQARFPPISFVDFGKRDYILSMLAFYELGDLSLAETSFVAAYKKSIERLGGINTMGG